jgi:flagellar hook-basal body complex protein FliE
MTDFKIGPALRPPEIFKPVPEIGGTAPKDAAGFTKVIKDVIGEAVDAEQKADQAISDFAAGKVDDVHDVVLAVGKANMAISLLVQVRNGLLEAYQELSRVS